VGADTETPDAEAGRVGKAGMMVASPNCKYIVVITDFYDPPVEAVRAFRCAPDAREWLWNYHGELYTKKPR
jgi:hypothetical protein